MIRSVGGASLSPSAHLAPGLPYSHRIIVEVARKQIFPGCPLNQNGHLHPLPGWSFDKGCVGDNVSSGSGEGSPSLMHAASTGPTQSKPLVLRHKVGSALCERARSNPSLTASSTNNKTGATSRVGACSGGTMNGCRFAPLNEQTRVPWAKVKGLVAECNRAFGPEYNFLLHRAEGGC
jgi:hypothetical protein